MNIQKPKGTYDILPGDAFKRHHLQEKLRSLFKVYNYKEILTPAFEKTELFKRGIGEETDIVSKEMYMFNEDKFTLRPEMTASVIRAYLENSLYNESPLKKLFYICNNFRRERPQAGRFREFWQYGVEAIGSSDITIDAELIELAVKALCSFGIKDIVTKINTIGTPEERKDYIDTFKEYLSTHLNSLSAESRIRFDKNPLRILDTKDEGDRKILENAPVLYGSLRNETKDKFEKLLEILSALNIKYEIDYKLVRGLDYYTHTTFEIMSGSLGAQNTLLGGGRYDLLVSQLGGKPTPAIGFAGGIERLVLVMEANKYKYPEEKNPDIYIVIAGDDAKQYGLKLISELREKGIISETDFLSRSIKSQMKDANRAGANYVVVLGEDEMQNKYAKLKRMSDGSETDITLFQVNTADYIMDQIHNQINSPANK